MINALFIKPCKLLLKYEYYVHNTPGDLYQEYNIIIVSIVQ